MKAIFLARSRLRSGWRVLAFSFLIFIVLSGLFSKRLELPPGKVPLFSGDSALSCVVTAVFDGDTVKVRFENGTQKRVRLIGVDSPEMDDSREEVAFWAHMAKQFCFYHLYKEEVRLTYDWQLEDSYGRLLAYVWKENLLFNEYIIRQGFAYVFMRFPFRKDYQKRFKEAEEDARREGRGFWKKGNFPWVSISDVKHHLGELVSVEFRCASIETKRGFLMLNAPGREFAALIPQKYISPFPESKYYLNKNVSVAGFLEEYRGQPQIIVYFPRQIHVEAGDENCTRSF